MRGAPVLAAPGISPGWSRVHGSSGVRAEPLTSRGYLVQAGARRGPSRWGGDGVQAGLRGLG